ncbi:arylsulfatase [Calycomorphotria hydatis]|uniref:Arylsulfatase n=1 Tax=Calycomorphotria hydatis TaxID=2528027 RepID=A0A517T540_9PLAN|nr:arylsulfatase [Calycomorphotria hydatis]QDT63488.1 Arylsulfatase [Calycomorphotria hydatis]
MGLTRRTFFSLLAITTCLFATCPQVLAANEKPANVIIVITDDQGYGDIGAHGNTMIQTPEMDRLWAESIRLTDFHVDPTCSPTRSALMSGRYSNRTGVWHTIMGRSLMSPDELSLAEIFRANGYHTGMFGKWHLGDNYPCRPSDQGFEQVVIHGGGGVTQGPDWWGNDYFDDTYWRNGVPEKFNGYCTDIWFDEAINFIEASKDKPFFCYLSTNAPHGPYLVAEEYSKPYADQGVPETMSKFYGMITNIDENLGKLRTRLDELGLAENTLLIFMSDNGTAAGVARKQPSKDMWPGYNAGMKGRKGSQYDGGHRVPFFVHWPAKGWNEGRDVDQLTAHIDVRPTLVDLLELQEPSGPVSDGTSLKSILNGDTESLRDRTLFVHSQRIPQPVKWKTTAVMTERWRLVNAKELYDIQKDPGQKKNLARQHPDVVAELSGEYDQWWESLKPTFDEHVRISIGADEENPVMLMSHDIMTEKGLSPWSQGMVEAGFVNNGPWAINVEQAGTYRIDLYRWPQHLDRAAECKHARLTVGDVEVSQPMSLEDSHASFQVELPAGPAMLQTWLTRPNDVECTAYFVTAERLK